MGEKLQVATALAWLALIDSKDQPLLISNKTVLESRLPVNGLY